MLTFLVLLALVGGVYILQSHVYSHHGLDGVAYRCYFDKEEVTEGDTVHLVEEIENRKFLPLPWLKSEFSVSKYLSFAGTHSVVTDKTRFVSSFFCLKSYSKIRREWKVVCTHRGEFTVERVLLVTADLLGTERVSASAKELGGMLTVLPKCCETAGELLPLCCRAMGEQPVKRSLLTDPFSVAGSRPYTGREPLRRMDWKTSARVGSLMVRTEEPAQQRQLVIAFTAQTGECGRRFVTDEAAEHTIRVCAQLFRECTIRQQPFAVYSCCTVHGTACSAPVSCSPQNYTMLLHALAALDVQPEDTLEHCLPPVYDSHLLIVSPYISEDVRRLKSRYPDATVCLTARGDQQGISCVCVFDDEEVSHA